MAEIGIVTAQQFDRRRGQIHVYDGEGKGKSQAALGVVLRSIGLGIEKAAPSRVLLVRFLKGPGRTYAEDAAIAALQRGFPHLIDQLRTGRGEFFGPDEITKFDRQEARRGWDVAKGALASGFYSVVVLDELNPVLDLGLLPVEEVVSTLKQKPEAMEVIITGRGAPKEIIDLADLHSEMRSVRRATDPQNGQPPCSGIEIYTGNGKGKSTSALGRALQAIGRGISKDLSHRVLIMQWLKGGTGYTEDAAIRALRESYPDLVDHQRCGRDAIVWRGRQQEIDYVEAERGWELARAAIASGLYKTIILDELNPTVDLELLDVEPIVQALLRKPRDTRSSSRGRCHAPLPYFELGLCPLGNGEPQALCRAGGDLRRGVDY
jgi:cob(I)yrinic acid a,c-diamide adenosyltransferase (EC 2.5.1.17)